MTTTSIVIFLLTAASVFAVTPNTADPAKHPYADPAKERDGIRFADKRVNSQRLYNFYARQADYYMARGDTPKLLPAYPGLDAGKYGHWGKYSQNQYVDNQWNRMDLGAVQSHWLKFNTAEYHPAIHARVGDDQGMVAHFDPDSASYPTIWTGGFLQFEGARWGMHSPAKPAGEILFENQRVADRINRRSPPALKLPHEIRYLGQSRLGKTVQYHYSLDGLEVKDRPWAQRGVFYRTVDWTGRGKPIRLILGVVPEQAKATRTAMSIAYDNGVCLSIRSEAGALIEEKDGLIWAVLTANGAASARIYRWKGKPNALEGLIDQQLPAKPSALYPEPLTPGATLAKDTGAYVVDDLNVPFQNPWRSRMFLSSIAFFPNGDALVSTLMGELWLVKGLSGNLDSVTWHRYATGLEQPMGIVIDKGEVFVLCRTQIARIYDRNKDGEADFIETHTPLTYSYPCMAGLSLDPDGYFWYVNGKGAFRVPRDQSGGPEPIADGLRNALASGMDADGRFYVGPQEGIITPTSFVAECQPKQFYGFNSRRFKTEKIAVPLVYVPRGIDNSTGGFVINTDERFGPLANTLLGLSFGNSKLYAILRNERTNGIREGAVVPLDGMTSSGICRGAVSPVDGQLYVVGINGWGDYAVADGCLHRYRYTGKSHLRPVDFAVEANGIRIDFSEALDRKVAESAKNYFAQRWQYEYSMGYGSHEYSIEQPDSLGHDHVDIGSVKLLSGGKSIFVEIPSLKPAMVQHLRMHLRTGAGVDFKTQLFTTIESLPSTSEKLALRVNHKVGKFHNPEAIGDVKVDKTYQLDAIPGLAFSAATLRAPAGKTIGIRFTNTDQMPHNLLIVAPGTYQAVGEASEKMLASPGAADKNYVPDSAKIIAQTPMVLPESEYDLVFKTPDEPGRYPYLCTFPGHWRLMKGELIVE